MKKLYLLSITFLFLIYFNPFVVCAAEEFILPPETLEFVQGGLQQMQLTGFYSNEMAPNANGLTVDEQLQQLQALIDVYGDGYVGSESLIVDRDDYVVYNEIPFDVLNANEHFICLDSNGNAVPWDDVRYAEFDNGYFKGHLLIDAFGNILSKSVDGISPTVPFCDASFGGSDFTLDQWVELYNTLKVAANENYNTLNTTGNNSGTNPAFYWFYGGSYTYGRVEFSVRVGNQYQQGHIIPINDNGVITGWYTNDLSMIQSQNYGTVNQSLRISEGTYSKNGYNYRYMVQFPAGVTPPANADYCIPYGENKSGVFAAMGTTVNPNIDGSNTVCFNTLVGDNPFDMNRRHSIWAILTGNDEIASLDGIFNPFYDPTKAETEDNPAYVINNTHVIDTTPSIGGVMEDSGAIEADPDTDYPLDVEITIPSGTDLDLPIVSGLTSRFPFSIPWDLKNLLKNLRARPEAPHFTGTISFAPLHLNYNVDIDLSRFDNLASIFRVLFLITFIIELAIFSYHHFFGS